MAIFKRQRGREAERQRGRKKEKQDAERQEAKKRKDFCLCFFASLLLSLSAPFTHAGIVPPSLKLEELARHADVVFKGTCEEKKTETLTHPETHQDIPIIVYTFRLHEVFKGNVGSVLEVRQLGITSRSQAMQLGLGFSDVTQFQKGRDYFLFLAAPSPHLGIRSVMGGGDDGKFELLKSRDGTEMVVNDNGNRGLFQGIPKKTLSKSEQTVVQAPPGPVPYEDFALIVKKVIQQ